MQDGPQREDEMRPNDRWQVVGRSLQQAGNVAVVETAEALQEAVVAGMAHIEIRAHLDLTVLDAIEGWSVDRLLGEIPESVKIMRVRC